MTPLLIGTPHSNEVKYEISLKRITQQAPRITTNRLYAPGETLGRLGLQYTPATRPAKLHDPGNSLSEMHKSEIYLSSEEMHRQLLAYTPRGKSTQIRKIVSSEEAYRQLHCLHATRQKCTNQKYTCPLKRCTGNSIAYLHPTRQKKTITSGLAR
jgi:hypothetical protein